MEESDCGEKSPMWPRYAKWIMKGKYEPNEENAALQAQAQGSSNPQHLKNY